MEKDLKQEHGMWKRKQKQRK